MKIHLQNSVLSPMLGMVFLLACHPGTAVAAGKAAPKPMPDFTTGETPSLKEAQDCTLGPTGARGWIYAAKFETTDARQIYVTTVDKGSPADGVLAAGDVILGLADRPFAGDARIAFGQAITEAEKNENRGVLRLLRWRAGKQDTATVTLKVMGSYGTTAPYDCPKSALIFEQGCKALAARMEAAPDKKHVNPIERSLNALALLSSGKAAYLSLLRKEARWAADLSIPDSQGFQPWWYGYVNLFLAEYVLATHDKTVVPGLQRLTLTIAKGQSAVGTWGHGFAIPNGTLGAYGCMNQPGLVCTLSMVLARMAGVTDPALNLAIERSNRFLAFYIGKGCIPYGDHPPWMETHDDNGKCGAGAVLFDLLGNAEGAAFFSRMTTASYGAERDLGHTGNFFNLLWALPGVSRAGPQATGAWMKESAWYFDLARRWDGTYVYQGEPGVGPADKTNHKYENWDSTGAYLLGYGVAGRKLYLTGRQPCGAPQLTAEAARAVIEDGRGWSPARKAFGYHSRSSAQLLAGLANWSPVVRQRSADELALRQAEPQTVPQLIRLLDGKDALAREGACLTLAAMKTGAAPAVPALHRVLLERNLWLRVKAASALANIGEPARSSVPDMLKLIAQPADPADPRGMLQRYLGFCLFYKGGALNMRGLLGNSLTGVDKKLLYPAVEAVLANQDGRVRGTIADVCKLLVFQEIKPLLPALVRAVAAPAPSGEMFADTIRLGGCELLAKNHIAEGIPLCVKLIEPQRWGFNKRYPVCFKVLASYGAAAQSQLPELRQIEAELTQSKIDRKEAAAMLHQTIAAIEASSDKTPLRSLKDF